MSTRINTNTTAYEAARNLSINTANENTDIQRLSSGLRINSAADDASGLVISESLQAQDVGLTQATSNTNDAINEVKTADGALNEVQSLLLDIRQKVLDAANTGVNASTALSADQQEIQQAVASINRIASTTQFNGNNLLVGDGTGTTAAAAGNLSLNFQIGANGGQTVQVSVGDQRAINLGKATSYTNAAGATSALSSGVSLQSLASGGSINITNTAGNGDAAQQALAIVDQALSDVSTTRATLGAVETNELQTNVNSLGVAQQNTEASLSAVRDTNISATVVDYTKNQILVQAGTSALTYANQAPQSVLKLLQ